MSHARAFLPSMVVMPGPEIDRLFARFLRGGDSGALAALFDATAPELLRVALYLVGDRHGAEDLVQATFVVAIEDARSHDPARPVLPWLLGILANRARELRKARAKELGREHAARARQQLGAGGPDDPADAAARAEFAKALAAALAALPSPYGEVLALHLDHGLTAKEIAQALRRPAGTVRTQVVRGMELLRAALPAGFAMGALVAVVPASSLSGVRAAVLARLAAQPAAAAAGAGTSVLLGGMLLMKAMLLAGGALLVAGIAYLCWSGGGDPSAAGALEAARAGRAAESRPDRDQVRVAADAGAESRAVATLRQEIAAGRAAGQGAMRVEVVWQDDGVPAAGLDVRYAPQLGEKKLGTWNTLRADERGVVEVAALAAGDWRVAACGTSERIAVGRDETARATLRVKPGYAFAGVVVDQKGAPVAGAEVRSPNWGEPRTLVTSRGDGTFAWRGEHGREIWAQKDGFAPSRMQLVPPYSGEAAHVRLELGAPGAPLEGQVLDARGVPAAGAVVLVSVDEALAQPLLPDGTRARNAPPVVLRADRAGRFATQCVPPGEHWVCARAPENAPAFVKVTVPVPPEQPLVVRLVEGVTVHGVVRDEAGRPVAAGIQAHFSTGQELGLWPLGRLVLGSGGNAKADAQGRYALRHLLPSTRAALECMAEGMTKLRHEVSLATGQDLEWNPVLARSGAISGRVIDAEENGLPGWRIRWQTSFERGWGREAQSDAAGRFELSDLSPGDTTLWAVPAEAKGAAETVMWGLTSARTGSRGVVLRTRWSSAQAGAIAGRLLDAGDGRPVTKAEIRIVPKAHGWDIDRSGEVDGGDGAFRVAPLPADTYTIDIRGSGYRQVRIDRIVEAGHTLDLGTVLLSRNGTVTVALRLPPGIRRDELTLRLGDERREYHAETFTAAAEGEWRSAQFPAGPAWIEAWGPRVLRCERAVEVKPGGDTKVELALAKAPAVRFVLVQPEPKQQRWTDWVRLTLRDAAGAAAEHVLQADGGATFAWIRGLAPGTYQITAILYRSEQMQGTAQVVVPPAGAEEQPPVEVRVQFAAKR